MTNTEPLVMIDGTPHDDNGPCDCRECQPQLWRPTRIRWKKIAEAKAEAITDMQANIKQLHDANQQLHDDRAAAIDALYRAEAEARIWRLVSVGAGIFSLLCLALVFRSLS